MLSVRIDESTSRSEMAGPALFYQNGTWRTVCSTNFTDVTARMICRSMGYYDGRAACCSAFSHQRWKTMNKTLEVISLPLPTVSISDITAKHFCRLVYFLYYFPF